MTSRSPARGHGGEPALGPYRVVVAGAGVAGLEAAIALRRLAGERVGIEVLEPAAELTYRPLAVAEPFGAGVVATFRLTEVLDPLGARHHRDRLQAVDVDARRVTTAGGDVLEYDGLLVAVGARRHVTLPGALTFGGPSDREALGAMLEDVASGRVRRLAFVVPSGPTWSLPLYELALMTASRGAGKAEIALVTPEEAPLSAFGREPSEAVARLLAEHGIAFVPGTHGVSVGDGVLHATGGTRIETDRVVTLPRLTGPRIAGLPCDRAGFVPTTETAAIRGARGVWGAGDATDFPIKQGGIAAQQGEVAARALAARAGVEVEPMAFRGVLRGLLLTGATPRYLRADTTGGSGSSSEIAVEPLWWPPSKIAARHLSPYLAQLAGVEPTEQSPPPDGVAVEISIAPGDS